MSYNPIKMPTSGIWCQQITGKKWKRVKFIVPFIFPFVKSPNIDDIIISNIKYVDCSNLRISKVTKTGIRFSIEYHGSWNKPGEVEFHWEVIV